MTKEQKTDKTYSDATFTIVEYEDSWVKRETREFIEKHKEVFEKLAKE